MTAEPKSVVEIAAASPDPRVRGLALRRMELARDLEPIDAFLGFYADNTAQPAAPDPIAKAKQGTNGRQVPAVRQDKTKPLGKMARMVAAICVMIMEKGSPMTLPDIWDGLGSRHSTLRPSSMDSLRARLSEHRDTIRRVDERGYWPTAVEAPVAHDS